MSSGPSRRRGRNCCDPEALEAEESFDGLGPGGVAGTARGPAELLAAPRPLHSLLRDQRVMTGIGRTWVDDILHAARLSPFKRGDDLSEDEADALREAIVGELQRVSTSTRSRSSSRCRRSSRSRRAYRAPGRAVPPLRDRAPGGVLRGLRDELLPALPDRGPRVRGPPALAAAEVAAVRREFSSARPMIGRSELSPGRDGGGGRDARLRRRAGGRCVPRRLRHDAVRVDRRPGDLAEPGVVPGPADRRGAARGGGRGSARACPPRARAAAPTRSPAPPSCSRCTR